MQIDRKLNLVFPAPSRRGEVFVHSTPISQEIFRSYFDIIAETVAQIHAKGLHVAAGPNIAALMLRKIAEAEGRWTDAAVAGATVVGVESGLLAEIRRLTNVIVPSPKGWQTLPFGVAMQQGIFDDAAADAVEGGCVFFTLASAIHGWEPERIAALLQMSGMTTFWRGQITPSNCTEYAASLPKSKKVASSGATEDTSSATS